MEKTLEKYLQDSKGKLTRKEQIDMKFRLQNLIASELRYIHRHHPQSLQCDLTPRNILLKGNKIKISDLGRASSDLPL